jgi:hypothetical protein
VKRKVATKKYALLLLLLISRLLYGQQVISTSGFSSTTKDLNISCTIGETIAQTLSNGNTVVTQGFNQPVLLVTRTAFARESEINLDVFPNPTSGKLTLRLSSPDSGNLQYCIFSMQGNILVLKKLTEIETIIDFSPFPGGIYFLKVQSGNRILETFKISKQ